MTVYVDDMYKYPIGQFGRMKMSHMIADTEDELHEMAGKIGIARRWYQGDHYDIALSKRALAISFGAVAITYRQLGCMAGLRKRGLLMGKPEDAEAALLRWKEERRKFDAPAPANQDCARVAGQ